MSEKNDTLVQVEHLKKYFPIRGGLITRTVGHGRYLH